MDFFSVIPIGVLIPNISTSSYSTKDNCSLKAENSHGKLVDTLFVNNDRESENSIDRAVMEHHPLNSGGIN